MEGGCTAQPRLIALFAGKRGERRESWYTIPSYPNLPKTSEAVPMSRLPAVREGLLITGARQTPVPIDSERWFAWLADARSFTFAGAAGSFTARHEERSGRRFWYAYRQRAGTLRKTYLGR